VSAQRETPNEERGTEEKEMPGLGKSGKIISINVSKKKGQFKTPVKEAELIVGKGISGDAHLGFGHRQVSLLMLESIAQQKVALGLMPDLNRRQECLRPHGVDSCPELKGKTIALAPGVFAENFTTQGIDLSGLNIGDELIVNKKIRLRVSQIGKECHTRCAIYRLVGDCIMPAMGIFCEVLESGMVKPGDKIERS